MLDHATYSVLLFTLSQPLFKGFHSMRRFSPLIVSVPFGIQILCLSETPSEPVFISVGNHLLARYACMGMDCELIKQGFEQGSCHVFDFSTGTFI